MKYPHEVLQFAPSRLLTAMAAGAAMASPLAHAQQTPANAPVAQQTAQAEPADKVLPTINVKGQAEVEPKTYQPGVTTIGKVPTLPRDVPQTLNIMNESLLLDRGVDSMKQALAGVAGITFNAAEGGTPGGDNINIRGFTARGDFYMDGMRDASTYSRDIFNDERIEVLKGPASMLFGRGSTGAVINQVSKSPMLIDTGRIAVTAGQYSYGRATVDVNKVTGEDAAFRLNAMVQDSDSAREGVTSKRYGFAPSFRWGIGTRDEFQVSYYHLNYDNTPDLGFGWFQGKPVDAAADKFYGFANYDYQKDSADVATANWTHRFDKDTTLTTALRVGQYTRDLFATQATLANGTTSINDNTTVSRGTQPANNPAGENTNVYLQSTYVTRAEFWGMGHQLVGGIDFGNEDVQNFTYTQRATKPATTFGDPDTMAQIGPRGDKVKSNKYKDTSIGVFGQDTLELTKQWKLLLGLRYDYFNADYISPPPNTPNAIGTQYGRTDRLWSYRGGLIYQPSNSQSYYVSIGNSYNTSGDLYQFDARGANTPPEESRNYELGGKWELFGGDLSLSAAIFRTEKFNERNTDPDTTSTNYLLSGKRHTNGLELAASGNITPDWQVYLSYTLQSARIDASNAPASVGQRPGNTPIYAGNIWTTYKVTPKWKIGGGVERMSQRTPPDVVGAGVSTWGGNTNVAPAYTRYDALIEYDEQDYALKLNILNLTNKVYWDALYRGHAVPGQARTVLLTGEYKW
uniref:TonB-dependent transporter n=1 Tax=Sphingomonas sp. A1 TaxID=90322 RepID=Q25C90_9SPHN|nr:TonB-dependent transporter [Sphingomonas sp. A1]